MTTDSEGGSVPTRVHVVDVNMPFSSMVGFILKWTLASIPAIVIMFVVVFVLSATFAGVLAGIGRAVR